MAKKQLTKEIIYYGEACKLTVTIELSYINGNKAHYFLLQV